MADYNKQTVANLRQLLKDRGIPSTGLTRKAQIIEKLEEWDSREESESEPAPAPAPAEKGSEPVPAVLQREDEAAEPGNPDGERKHVLVKPEIVPEPVQQPETPAIEVTTTTAPDTMMAEPTSENMPMAVEANAPATAGEPASTTDAPEATPVPDVEDCTPAQATLPASEPAIADFAMADRTPSPAPDEKPSVEKADLFPIPERSATSTAEPSRLSTEELEADTRKRKRRSLTPDLPSRDVRAKKRRPSENAAPEIYLQEDRDADTMMEQRQSEEQEQEADENSVNDTPKSVSKSESKMPETEQEHPETRTDTGKKEKGPLFRGLFRPTVVSAPTEALTDDRPIAPALHAATAAIYIRNFMRPLRPDSLRAHLVSLATPPSSSPDPSIVKTLFLDGMKTHALVLFSSTTAASRVRASLHGSIWPPEGNRKDLWVDFVPEDKVEDWIKEEEDAIAAEKEARGAGRPTPAKKYEVVYSEADDGTVTAVFQELGASASAPAWNPPKGPRRASQQLTAPAAAKAAPTEETRQGIEKSFKTLDELFLSTTAKPPLYYLPVSDERSEARLKDLDLETARDWAPEERRKGRGMVGSRLDQKVRFGFDDEDRVIELGFDFGPWADDSRGGGAGRGGFRGVRGGRGGGYRGGGRGGWRSGN
ncbi:hypothetical protein K458DRAFT_481011 [Lentithecium fluviatile CBS 122367]|uniref:SAP domain-containing protein n=1 Tax=Lentithecium fluviatile CBS 122367 TaxID=1168545 RepID=A0A6G1IIQ5_9PLEO|nr:hypothetical protein K458DRAFT_481011 [Lentithecium fluviatile CBS 122367]